MGSSAIYEGVVTHRRLRPRWHQFQYSVFAMLLELDELAAPDRNLKLFAYNRWGLFSFQDRDHGDGRELQLGWMISWRKRESWRAAPGGCSAIPASWAMSSIP
jgi:DUF1365 family protein